MHWNILRTLHDGLSVPSSCFASTISHLGADDPHYKLVRHVLRSFSWQVRRAEDRESISVQTKLMEDKREHKVQGGANRSALSSIKAALKP